MDAVTQWGALLTEGATTDRAERRPNIRFPKICSRLFFPKLALEGGETGMITLNEGLLSGSQIARLNVRVCAAAEGPLLAPAVK